MKSNIIDIANEEDMNNEEKIGKLISIEERLVALTEVVKKEIVSSLEINKEFREENKKMWNKIDLILNKLVKLDSVLSDVNAKKLSSISLELAVLKNDMINIKSWRNSMFRIISPVMTSLITASILGGLFFMLRNQT